MDNKKVKKFKNRLLKERKKVKQLINIIQEDETMNAKADTGMELSYYDNHPSDTATELFEQEKALALKGNEMNILNKIDSALEMINEGTYGICKRCGKNINMDRLNFIPYAEYCVECQKEINSPINYNLETREFQPKNRPIEESIIRKFFGYTNADIDRNAQVGFDGEDSYQSVGMFNRRDNIYYDYIDDDNEGYVEPIEKISNEQYKNSLQ